VYKRILVAVDDSKVAEGALREAWAASRREESPDAA